MTYYDCNSQPKKHVFVIIHTKDALLTGQTTTPPKFNIAPEKSWWEDYFPIGKVTFQGLC